VATLLDVRAASHLAGMRRRLTSIWPHSHVLSTNQMHSPRNWTLSICILIAALLLACSSDKPVLYTPRPERADDPVKTLEDTINTSTSPPAKLEVTDKYIKETRITNMGVITGSVVYADIGRVELYQDDDVAIVAVFDINGDKVYTYETKSLDRAQLFIDALSALRQK
jgi:hypothetical protein